MYHLPRYRAPVFHKPIYKFSNEVSYELLSLTVPFCHSFWWNWSVCEDLLEEKNTILNIRITNLPYDGDPTTF